MAVGIIDVKSYYIETAQDVANRVRACLKHAPPTAVFRARLRPEPDRALGGEAEAEEHGRGREDGETRTWIEERLNRGYCWPG